MTTHHYLQAALIFITLIGSPYCAAILFDPVEIYSTAGELFYAEIGFNYAQPNDQLEISLADAQDLQLAQLPLHTSSDFNLHLRRHRNARQGRIVITSTRPVYPSELKLLLKIKIGNQSYLQQIQNTRHPDQVQTSPRNSKDKDVDTRIDAPDRSAKHSSEQILIPRQIVHEEHIALQHSGPEPETTYRLAQPQTPVSKDLFRAVVLQPSSAMQHLQPQQQPQISDPAPPQRPFKPMPEHRHNSPVFKTDLASSPTQ